MSMGDQKAFVSAMMVWSGRTRERWKPRWNRQLKLGDWRYCVNPEIKRSLPVRHANDLHHGSPP